MAQEEMFQTITQFCCTVRTLNNIFSAYRPICAHVENLYNYFTVMIQNFIIMIMYIYVIAIIVHIYM